MTARIDQPRTPEGSSRCPHDMLDGQCAWCKGLPDIPDTVLMDALEHEPKRRLKWVRIDMHGTVCRGGCDADLRIGMRAAWSPLGLICEDCAETETDVA